MRSGLLVLALLSTTTPSASFAQDDISIERGRYVAITSGCNDCHTAGYGLMEGNVPETEWLKGDALGWRGPWGTTYAVNLRLFFHNMSGDEWVAYARALKTRPPMPWFNLRQMSEPDLLALHRYITSLEGMGDPAPAYVPPDQEPTGPVVQFPAGP